MPFQKGNTHGAKGAAVRVAKQQQSYGQPLSGFTRAATPPQRPAVEPGIDEPHQDPDLKSEIANEISRALHTPIVAGGQDDEEPEDMRESYNEQSYANDPVHEEWFNTSDRSVGPLSIDIDSLEIDGRTYKLGWIPCKIGNEVHTEALQKARMRGWEPVPMDRLPKYYRSFAFKSDLGDNLYIVKDNILMMLPIELHKKWEEFQQRIADARMRRVEQYTDFTGSLAPGVSPMIQPPTRQAVRGRTATAAVQDALENFSQGGGQRVASTHTVRGFGPHR